MEPGEVGTPVDGAAAHRVVHVRRDGGVILVYRIVLRQPAEIGVGMEVGLPVQLCLRLVYRKGVQRHPAALLQAHHLDPGLGQAPRESSAGSAGPDDQDVGNVVLAAHRCFS